MAQNNPSARRRRARSVRIVSACLIVVFISAGGLWWVSDRYVATHAAQALRPILRPLNSDLSLQISNIREKQSLTQTPPYYSPGGSWTIFDISPPDFGDAKITIAVDSASGKNPKIDHIAFIPSDREAAAKFVAAFADALHHDLPPRQSPQLLAIARVEALTLSPSDAGPLPPGANWTSTQLYLNDDWRSAQVHFNFDLNSRRAQFSEPPSIFSDELLPVLAAVVRDGPRPPRTPQNDPTYTTDVPRVVNLKAIPDSKAWIPNFARGGKLLILSISTNVGTVRVVPLESPEKSTLVGTFNGMIEGAINEDPDGARFLVFQAPIPLGKGMAATGAYQLWRVDRVQGTRREIKAPSGAVASAVYPHDHALSPDGRYLVVKCIGLPNRALQTLCVIDLTTEQFTQIRTPRADLVFACWLQGPDGSPQLLLSVEDAGDWDNIPHGQKFLANPRTGVITDMPTPPLPTPEQLFSPDGRHRLSIHTHESLDVIDLINRKVRTFVFREQDRRFIDDRMFTWLDSRYVECSTFFIDIATMKQGDLPMTGTKDEPRAYTFSPDFKWAIAGGVLSGPVFLGQVVVPDLPAK